MPPTKVMLVRHAEKPIAPPPYGITLDGEQDAHSLIARGWQRAGALVPFFATPWIEGIATPTALYASALAATADAGDDVGRASRARETLQPLADRLNLDVDSGHAVGDETALVDTITRETGIVLVAWEHKHLAAIVRSLGCAAPGDWPDARFDLVWICDGDADGRHVRQIGQSLLSGDAP